MTDIKRRLANLETKRALAAPVVVVFDWGGPALMAAGQQIPREEYERLYPGSKVITYDWGDGPGEDLPILNFR